MFPILALFVVATFGFWCAALIIEHRDKQREIEAKKKRNAQLARELDYMRKLGR